MEDFGGTGCFFTWLHQLAVFEARALKGKEAALWTNVSCQRAGCHRQAQRGKLDMPPSCPIGLFFVSSFVLTAALACNGVEHS